MNEMYKVKGASPNASERVPFGTPIDVDNLKGFTSMLGVVTNIGWKSSTIGCYFIPWKLIQEDYSLCWALFGRKASSGALKVDKYLSELLAQHFGKYLEFKDTGKVYFSSVEKYAETVGDNGHFAENDVAEWFDGKLGSPKMDKNQKIDICILHTWVQMKESIVYPDSHGSGCTTNGKATN